MKVIRSYTAEIILSILGITIYMIVFFNLKIGVNEWIMFSTPDSLTYLDVANWLSGADANHGLSIRPILYPLILLVSTKIAGVYGIWISQLLMWMATLNIIFIAVRKATNNMTFAFIASLFFASNLSLIALTMHGLAEVTTAFLLASFALFLIANIDRRRELYYLHGIIIFLVFLTILKPVFFPPLLFTLIIVLPLFFLRKYLIQPTRIIILFILLIPLFIQLGIMKTNCGEFTVSRVGPITLTNYFFTKGVMRVEEKSRREALEKAGSLDRNEKINFILANKQTYYSVFIDNLKENITAKSTSLCYASAYENPGMKSYMDVLNQIYYYIHIVFLFILGFLIIIKLKVKDYKNFILLSFLSAIVGYYILTSGVSYLQGDRLILPAIGVWPILYTISLYMLINSIKSRKLQY